MKGKRVHFTALSGNRSSLGLLQRLQITLNRNKLGELLVIKGHITSLELREALKNQKNTLRPLGQILVDLNFINQWQLRRILFCQNAMRTLATVILFIALLSGVSKKARAEISDIPLLISVADQTSDAIQLGSPEHFPPLFGTKEKQSRKLDAFTKWMDMFTRFESEIDDSSSKSTIQSLKASLGQIKSLSLRSMAQEVNTMMNRKKYILDSKNWGKSDYWATPVEFLKHGGDCEDYAIAKYVALRALGVSEERLRVVIVQDLSKNIPHAILVVYTQDGPVVLDNQNKDVLNADSLRGRYKPIFSINRTAWWLHTTPESTVIASAQ